MKKIIICLVICLFNLPAAAIDYNDFPPDLQQILDERITELESKDGLCVAGRITMSDEKHIGSGEDVKINFYQGVDEPLWVYDGGWFITGRVLSPSNTRRGKNLILRAFGYDPIDASIAIQKGEITYAEFELNKTPAEKLVTITGTVINEMNEPVEGAAVNLTFPLATHGIRRNIGYTYPHKETTTDKNGQYLFKGLSSAEHSLLAAQAGYAYHSIRFTPSAGEQMVRDLKLCKKLKILVDYVYQADGNQSFTEGNIKSGTVEWINGNEGIDFEDGKTASHQHRDLELRQDQDKLIFRIFYVNVEGNGFYDAGEVDFESVTQAGETGYSTNPKPCVVGHTYIVKTFEKNYAKFIVKSISESE